MDLSLLSSRPMNCKSFLIDAWRLGWDLVWVPKSHSMVIKCPEIKQKISSFIRKWLRLHHLKPCSPFIIIIMPTPLKESYVRHEISKNKCSSPLWLFRSSCVKKLPKIKIRQMVSRGHSKHCWIGTYLPPDNGLH